MRNEFLRPLGAAALTLALLTACSATRLAPQSQLPPLLVERVPARVGVHYSQEFREFMHKETRAQVDYEISLGPAHVQNLDWLLKGMFSEIVPVEDPTRAAEIRPPLTLVLEPKFEEYSFLTPRDVAGDAFIVTIRYLLTVYDGTGGRVDAFTLTGYGREPARALGSAQPLKIATQRAMRDAGAKVAVELVDQDSVRLLLRGPPEPLPPPAVPAAETPPAAEAPVAEPPDSGPGG